MSGAPTYGGPATMSFDAALAQARKAFASRPLHFMPAYIQHAALGALIERLEAMEPIIQALRSAAVRLDRLGDLATPQLLAAREALAWVDRGKP